MAEVKRKSVPAKKKAIVIEEAGTVEKKLASTKKLKSEIVGVDTSLEDVLKWSKEGRTLFFSEDEDFLELPEEVVRELSLDNRRKYDVARGITFKQDVVGTIEDSLKEWVKDYNIIPGSASAKTAVSGKDPHKDYRWARKELLGKHIANGYKVTRDPKVKAGDASDTCSFKAIGGEQKPEMVLVERPKDVTLKIKSKRKQQRDSYSQATMDNYVESAARQGFEANASDS
jgi:hypothetical protein